MAIEFIDTGKDEQGRTGTSVLTVLLTPMDEEAVGSFGDEIRSGKTHMIIPNNISGNDIRIEYDAIIKEFPDVDLDTHRITIINRFTIDHENNPPLYPSDMLDELRAGDMSEEDIQALLDLERRTRK